MIDETDIEDENPRKLPEKFRASADPKDAEAFARLQANDEAQKKLREQLDVPFVSQTPKQREMANALIFINTLENARENQKLTDAQIEQLAEAYATIGQYRTAGQITLSKEKAGVYEKYWQAVWLDDEDWCEHPQQHKYIKDSVFSAKEGKFMPLLACNVCGVWNVLDAPEHLLEAQRTRAAIRTAVKGMDNAAVKRYLQTNFRH